MILLQSVFYLPYSSFSVGFWPFGTQIKHLIFILLYLLYHRRNEFALQLLLSCVCVFRNRLLFWYWVAMRRNGGAFLRLD